MSATFVPRDATDGAHDVYLHGLDPHLENPTWVGQIRGLEGLDRKPERADRIQHLRGVVERRADEQIRGRR